MSELLRNRPIFRWREDKPLRREEQALIDQAVRRLVMLMVALEVKGEINRDVIEEAVLKAFEKNEFVYYGLDEYGIMSVIKMEARNEEGRRRHSKGL